MRWVFAVLCCFCHCWADIAAVPCTRQVLPDCAGPVLDFGEAALAPSHERWAFFMNLAEQGRIDNGMAMQHASRAGSRASKAAIIRTVLDMADVDSLACFGDK